MLCWLGAHVTVLLPELPRCDVKTAGPSPEIAMEDGGAFHMPTYLFLILKGYAA